MIERKNFNSEVNSFAGGGGIEVNAKLCPNAIFDFIDRIFSP
jgi:hypothetical protein